MNAVENWGEANSPKREVIVGGMVVEMKGRGFKPTPSQERQMVEAPADSMEMLSQLVRTW